MKLHNTLTRSTEYFAPLYDNRVRVYSCGPTVYDHAHIGNLYSYIFADTLRRTLKIAGYEVNHAMNYTDIDDKTIRRSREQYPDDDPHEALAKLTNHYIMVFLDDMQSVGNDTKALEFLRATDAIEAMQALITDLLKGNFAYLADDGIYFSIDAYKNAGHTYGQLTRIDATNTSAARIANDEYDKESVHDFALWKKQKDGEPAWDFTVDGTDMRGRPGWHIECSAMSQQALGQPFDIHTGGVDLKFPHHENEIAQSTALEPLVNARMAQFFTHNEHILVDGKKMAKSENNFFTLTDITEKGYDPLAFRLLVLQSHYRSQLNFTWESLQAAQNRLNNLRRMADLAFQPVDTDVWLAADQSLQAIDAAMQNDLSSPEALAILNEFAARAEERLIATSESTQCKAALVHLDNLLGLHLSDRQDITDEQKALIIDRERARQAKDWPASDKLRDQLKKQGIGLRDTPHGPIWSRTNEHTN